MSQWITRAIDRSAEFNDRAAAALTNGFDWLFRHDKLVKSGQTPFELVFTSDLMTVRYYALGTEEDIQLNDGSLLPIQRPQHAVPLVLVPPLGVTTETFDLMPKRSLVRYMAARGFKTYLICWGTPQRRHAKLGMKDYADRMLMDAIDPEYLARAEQVIAGQMGVESLHRYCTATAPALHRPCTGARHLMGEVAAGETRCSTTGCWPGQP